MQVVLRPLRSYRKNSNSIRKSVSIHLCCVYTSHTFRHIYFKVTPIIFLLILFFLLNSGEKKNIKSVAPHGMKTRTFTFRKRECMD